ncbi:hypothetical protein [Streptomyces sp. NPDC001774]
MSIPGRRLCTGPNPALAVGGARSRAPDTDNPQNRKSRFVRGMMQDFPLTLNHFVSRAQSVHRASRITAATPEGGRQRVDLASWARRVQRVGPLLDRLGVSRGARVGTLAWNTVQHLELTFGVPCSGRILHAVTAAMENSP